MNVYDFDDTIFKGDSTRDFYLFCLLRHPRVIRCLPRQVWAMTGYVLGRVEKRRMKEAFFSFLPHLPDVEGAVDAYWNSRRGRIKAWYLAQKQPRDVIISASPEFLLAPMGRQLGVERVIATRVDPKTGRIKGKNCRGQEKVARFALLYPHGEVDGFYSDHESDTPMAQLARQAFLVQGEQVRPWPGKGAAAANG